MLTIKRTELQVKKSVVLDKAQTPHLNTPTSKKEHVLWKYKLEKKQSS